MKVGCNLANPGRSIKIPVMEYIASDVRYDSMPYVRCGSSGLLLPRISLGLWQNFGGGDDFNVGRDLILHAFDAGITHFDLANNYGPPPGAAEQFMGRLLQSDLRRYRDEIIISTKAGFLMWPGPYGEWGSRKNLLASLDQSLKRMGLDYVDIFYHHRPDPDTPLEETAGALVHAVRSGKALYVGISNYNSKRTREMAAILRAERVPCIIHQVHYSMLTRRIEGDGLLPALAEEGMGAIIFSPLEQGILAGRYLRGKPSGSRLSKGGPFLGEERIQRFSEQVAKLAALADMRGQTLAQMALAWVLRQLGVTSVLIGASSISQLDENMGSLQHPHFDADELKQIDAICCGDNAG